MEVEVYPKHRQVPPKKTKGPFCEIFDTVREKNSAKNRDAPFYAQFFSIPATSSNTERLPYEFFRCCQNFCLKIVIPPLRLVF